MRQPLIAGNWKLNGGRDEVRARLKALKAGYQAKWEGAVSMLVCPPSIYLPDCQLLLSDSPIQWGSQSHAAYEKGAYTGELAASMVIDFGASYALVGHSERRHLFGVTDAIVATKAQLAIDQGLIPIVCVGETLEERDAGEAEEVIGKQLLTAIKGIIGSRFVVAYEPVWAIGTGRAASLDDVQAMLRHIRTKLAQEDVALAEQTQLLYGGSVTAENAADLCALPDVDGALVGGASLKSDQFLEIVNQCFKSL